MTAIYPDAYRHSHIAGSSVRAYASHPEYVDITLDVDVHTTLRWGFVHHDRANRIVTALESAVAAMRADLDAAAAPPEPGALDVAEVGDVLGVEGPSSDRCRDLADGLFCTRAEGHTGQHVAQGLDGRVLAVAPAAVEAVAS